MKKTILLLHLILVTNLLSKSQTITIPDTEFANWIQSNYPTCITGDQLDTACINALNISSLSINSSSISNFTGIEWFVDVTTLNLDYNSFLTTVNLLPPALQTLYLQNCSACSLLSFPSSLKNLHLSNTPIGILPALSPSLIYLDCSAANLTSLPTLPDSLQTLMCGNNTLTSLPTLPSELIQLNCEANQLATLPTLNPSIETLDCRFNLLTLLPGLPNSLKNLLCNDNALTELPPLSWSLQQLDCSNNMLTELPNLPYSLLGLFCANNQLTSVPTFPQQLGSIDLTNNPNLYCLTNIPMNLAYNAIYDGGTGITCYPNYSTNMNSSNSKTLCLYGDAIDNPNACPGFIDVIVSAFSDYDHNCNQNIYEHKIKNLSFSLYDTLGNLFQTKLSNENDSLFFNTAYGTYRVVLDSIPPFLTPSCITEDTVTVMGPIPGFETSFFGFDCSGFDNGAVSVLPTGWVFPGEQHQVNITAGDLSQLYSVSCSDSLSISGIVSVTYTGPVSFVSAAPGALVPTSVVGNTISYTVSDFGLTDCMNSFNFILETDTTAVDGDSICIQVVVTNSVGGDLNTDNNSFDYCYRVINSYDPNIKIVNKNFVPIGFNDEIIYTIYFQNTGSAPAFNISIEDTIDSALDLNTISVLNQSHDCITSINHVNRKINFAFNSIMLPDSASNPLGSIGFVQFSIRPTLPMIASQYIYNKAYIFFDYNAPIITNSAFTTTSLLGEENILRNDEKTIVFPNPANTSITIKTNFLTKAQIFDLNGKLVMENNSPSFAITELENGIYILKVFQKDTIEAIKLIKAN